ncbi:hypothetical protein G6F50_015312 [Rhizopus delemar]|uniref:Uncharacterized protein n=1 Tax=Rhizopus delemar TaxID=936053 RepID=A0A9P6XZK5_9FUNG|nr:hypothetical protein G6F50_015312 [Rhizopus delemar]
MAMRQVALVGEAGAGRGVRQRLAGGDQPAGEIQAAQHHAPAVVARGLRQLVQRDRLAERGMDELPGALCGGVVGPSASLRAAGGGAERVGQVVERVVFLQGVNGRPGALQQGFAGGVQPRVGREAARDERQRPAAQDLLDQRGFDVDHAVVETGFGACLSVVRFVRVQHDGAAWQAVPA